MSSARTKKCWTFGVNYEKQKQNRKQSSNLQEGSCEKYEDLTIWQWAKINHYNYKITNMYLY